LPKPVVADANTIQLRSPEVRIWAESAGSAVSQLAAETMGIWQDMGGLTTQWMDIKVRERVWDIA